MNDPDRALRLQDFERRSIQSPGDVFEFSGNCGRYIAIHPLADDVALLDSMGMSPEDCHSADVYWEIGGEDVALLQVQIRRVALGREPGIYARWSSGEPPIRNLVAVVEGGAVTKDIVEESAARFFDLNILEMDLEDRLSKLATSGDAKDLNLHDG